MPIFNINFLRKGDVTLSSKCKAVSPARADSAEGMHCRRTAHPICEFDVGKALGLARVPVHDDAHVHYFAGGRKKLEELLLAGLQGQVVGKNGADVAVELHQLPFAFPLLLDLWRCRLSPVTRTEKQVACLAGIRV